MNMNPLKRYSTPQLFSESEFQKEHRTICRLIALRRAGKFAAVMGEQESTFAVQVMEESGIRIAGMRDIPEIAETARRELRA